MTKLAPPKTLALIDGKSVFYRGYYAMPNLSTRDGVSTGGVYGFASLALELLRQIQPDYVAVAWDKPKTNIRRRLEIYDKYKANRKPAPPDFYAQIPLLHELLEAFGWPLYELDDYEADDIMGTLSAQANAEGIHTVMISSDLDMLQVVDSDTELYALKKGLANLEKFDVPAFETKYGLKVTQFLDLKSLKGDASDNIPGVLGIGEKTAVALLQEFGSMDNLYQHLDQVKPAWRTKLEAGHDLALMSRELAKIWTDAPLQLDLAAVDVRNLDPVKLRANLEKLEFTSLIRRLPDYMRSGAAEEVDLVEASIQDSSEPSRVLLQMSDEIVAILDGDSLYLSTAADSAVKMPLGDGLALLRGKKVIGHDVKSLAEVLLRHDPELDFEVQFDTKLTAFLLDSLRKAPTLAEAIGWLEIDDEGQTVDLTPGQQVTAIWSLYQKQRVQLAEYAKLNRLAREVDFPLQLVIARIERRGVRLDASDLATMSRELGERTAAMEQEIWSLVGYEFNISSAPQLSEALFTKLQLPTAGIKRSARGYYSTGKKELDKLHGQHPIISKITEIRELLKLRNTYVDVLPGLMDDHGYLHTDFRQDVAATGRLSSSNPNLQNIPIRTDLGQRIRRAFVASEGKILVSADYSQFELRLAAAMAGDTNLIEDFQDESIDIHTKTAAEAYSVSFDDVTPEMRRHAKVINFGVLYGMSPHGLAAATGMTFTSAKEFIERYFAVRQPIRDFLDATIQQAETEGYVETLFGRRRPTPDIKSSNYMAREAAKRAAANMPIQGTEADLMKMAMLRVERELGTICQQILQIHDSILVECDPADLDRVAKSLKHLMETIYPDLGVRLKVDVKSGQTWADL
ncbi:MAG: DNA polymerase I [Sphaerimonospora mesophila]